MTASDDVLYQRSDIAQAERQHGANVEVMFLHNGNIVVVLSNPRMDIHGELVSSI
jgi:hypothetical protein